MGKNNSTTLIYEDESIELTETEEELLETIFHPRHGGDMFNCEMADDESLKGDVELRDKNNVLVFYGLREDIVHAYFSLQDRGILQGRKYYGDEAMMAMMVAGGLYPIYPIAKSPTRKYKKDRWVPVLVAPTKEYRSKFFVKLNST